MARQINVDLLKEYIKTLIAAEVIFPGILPRQWGNEFSRTELQAIHFTLKFVLKTADDPQTRESLAKAYKQVEEPDLNLHWFLCDFWEDIVPLLIKYPYSAVRKPLLHHEFN